MVDIIELRRHITLPPSRDLSCHGNALVDIALYSMILHYTEFNIDFIS